MKVAVITILDNINFGTYLQALATARTIQSFGHEAEIIHYIRPSMTAKGLSNTILKERGVIRWLNHMRYIPGTMTLREKDFRFLSSFVPLSIRYESFEDLVKKPPVADIYMTGSDQVWNSIYNHGIDKSFFLDFVPPGKRCVAYAASIGMDTFPEDEVDEIRDLLHKYTKITVRELTAKRLLSSIGIDSEVVLDPTLLIDCKEWECISKKYPFPINETKPYLLIYSVETKQQNNLIQHYAVQVAQKYNLKIYQVSYSSKFKKDFFVDKVFCRATPDVFLSLMMHASFAIVSSFHGTAFAINFKKQFLTITPQRFSSRVDGLLSLLSLQNRKISDKTVNINSIDTIDYNSVNTRLQAARMHSLCAFKQMLIV